MGMYYEFQPEVIAALLLSGVFELQLETDDFLACSSAPIWSSFENVVLLRR